MKYCSKVNKSISRHIWSDDLHSARSAACAVRPHHGAVSDKQRGERVEGGFSCGGADKGVNTYDLF